MVQRKRKRELAESPKGRRGRKEGIRKRRRMQSAISPHRSTSRSPSMETFATGREVKLRRRSPSMQTFADEKDGNWKTVLYELKQVNFKLEELRQVNYKLEELFDRIFRLEKILSNFAEVEEKREEAEKQNKNGNCILM